MIKSKNDLYSYIKADLNTFGFSKVFVPLKKKILSIVIPYIWKYEIILRKTEYYSNCREDLIGRIICNIYKIRLYKYGIKLGFSIPINTCGPGLRLCHIGTVVINPNSRIGKNARIHVGVNIGNYSKFDGNWVPTNAPIIGDNVYIGPGAKLFGSIHIGNDVAIGANSVVNKDVENHVTVAGVPCRVINKSGSDNMIIKGMK
ncbi:MAG: hypothetical protein K6F27_10250 [Ruminococcus sp.]|nr:hypothetical protein [Ruminococcus sp.]